MEAELVSNPRLDLCGTEFLCRLHQEFYSRLPDERRLSDFDGRGYLSERRLQEFCEFALATAVDQLDFMHDLLNLDGMRRRIAGYAERRESNSELPRGSAVVLGDVFIRGEIIRGSGVTLAVPTAIASGSMRVLAEALRQCGTAV